MNKCSFTSNSVEDAVANAMSYLYDYLETNTLNLDNVSKLFSDICRSFIELYEVSIDDNSVSEYINYLREGFDMLYENENGVSLLNEEWFSVESIKRLLTEYNLGRQDASLITTSNEVLVTLREGRSRLDASLDFINKAYGTATLVKDAAVRKIKTDIFDVCFLDRSGRFNGDLNDKIRQYLLELFNNIIDYFNTYVPGKLNITNTLLYRLNPDGLWVSTGVWENDNIYLFIKEKLSPQSISNLQLAKLNRSKSSKDLALLKAYNSFTFLNKFDSLLDGLFGNAINILRFGCKDGSNKYSFGSKTGNLINSYRKDDLIFLEEEMDKITKLLIETTLLIDLNGNKLTDQYLTNSDFFYITALFKTWVTDALVKLTMFSLEDLINLKGVVSRKTIKILLNYSTLSSLIAASRLNYQDVMTAIAELYNNTNIILNLDVYTELTKDVKIKLHTIFNSFYAGGNSIRSMSDIGSKFNVYRNLCLTADSTFINAFTLYYLDADGKMYTRMLSDLTTYKLKVNIAGLIKNINSPFLIKDFKLLIIDKYGWDGKAGLDGSLVFTLPAGDGNIILTVNKKNETVLITYSLGELTRNLNIDSEYTRGNLDIRDIAKLTLFKFADSLIGTNFEDDPVYFDIFALKLNLESAISSLFSYCGRVLSRMYISNVDLAPFNSVRNRRNKFIDIVGNELADSIGYDKIRNLVDLSGKTSVDSYILEDLAKAKGERDGLYSASTINNSEDKAQSNLALSKLLGSYAFLWENLELSRNSATQNMDILNIPGLFTGVTTVNEQYSIRSGYSKKANLLTPQEFFETGFLLDYLSGIYSTNKYRTITNNIVHFLASVNSDKNTINKIGINLNTTISPNDSITYLEADLNDIYKKISKNLGVYYANILDRVNKDYSNLEKYIPNLIPGYQILGIFDYTNNFARYHQFFDSINKNRIFKSEEDFINKLLLEAEHEGEHIELVLNVHYTGKNTLKASNTLLAQVYRFTNSIPNNGNWSTFSLFFNTRLIEFLADIIDSNSKLNINNLEDSVKGIDKNGNIIGGILKNLGKWVDSTGDIIYAFIDGKPIKSKNDFIDIFGNVEVKYTLLTDTSKQIEINPELLKFNALHYLFTLLWMATTVGSFIGHPAKVKEDITANVLATKYPYFREMYEESALFIALAKRNVSFTALMNLFLLNDVRGINSTYKIAVIKDLHKSIDILTLSNNETSPFDGATFASPDTVYLENNSLAGNSSGLTKKTFVHFKNEKTGTGGIIKTAVFGLTNDNMKGSPETLLNLYYKMSNGLWKDLKGNILDNWDLTKSDLHQGSEIAFIEDLYFKLNGKLYQIIKLDYQGNNSYNRTIIEVDEKGNPIGKLETEPIDNVNSNWEAWKLFGGLHSMELKEGTLTQSENSIKLLVECMNEKGIPLAPGKIETLNDFYLPMKHSLILYVVTEGAIKQGAANINPATSYEDDSELLTMYILMTQAGTQLDKEHHADLSEVSLPTLVITACSSLGYSFIDADVLYKGIASISLMAIGLLAKESNANMPEYDMLKFNNKLTKIIIDNLANATSQNFGSFLSLQILETAKLFKQEEFNWALQGLPISDNTIFNRAINILSNYVTKNAIKLKMPGSLAIMTPGYKSIVMYGNKRYNEYDDPGKDILKELKNTYNKLIVYSLNEGSASNVLMGHKYKILTYTDIIKYKDLGDSIAVLFEGLTVIKQKSELDKLNKNLITYDGNIMFEDYTKLALYSCILDKTINRRRKLLSEEDYDYNIRMYSEADEEFLTIANNNYSVKVDYREVTLEDNDPNDINNYNPNKVNYRRLKEACKYRSSDKIGEIKEIIEYIMDGRDLGSYNVYFKSKASPIPENIDSIILDKWIEYIDKLYPELGIDIKTISKNYRLYLDNFRIEDYVLDSLANYNGEKINYLTIARETHGISESSKPGVADAELLMLKWLTNKKSGIDFSKFINRIWEERPLHFVNVDYETVRNILIDYLKNANSKSGYKELLYNLIMEIVPNYNYDREMLLQQGPDEEFRLNILNNYIENSFNIWDLASVQAIQSIKDKNSEEYKIAYSKYLRDLKVLSSKYINIEDTFNKLILKYTELIDAHSNLLNLLNEYLKNPISKENIEEFKKIVLESENKLNNWKRHIANLGILLFSKHLINPEWTVDEQIAEFTKLAKNTVDIYNTDGSITQVTVDKLSITHTDYEIVMPKIYKTTFGLKENEVLADIVNNKNYFVKLNIKSRSSKIDLKYFDIEIKNNTGDHKYIAIKNNAKLEGFRDVTDAVNLMVDEDGVTWILDNESEPLYLLKKGTRIFLDKNGVLVYIIENTINDEGKTISWKELLDYYLNEFEGDEVNVSNNAKNLYTEELELLVDSLLDSKWYDRYIDLYIDDVTNLSTYLDSLSKIQHLTESDIDQYNNRALSKEQLAFVESTPEFISGREKYNSFIESLKIIAARIPAQNMLSFMGMKIVGFSNGDLNTAYVSDYQILLLGSDFDIDSVTLISYDINKLGKLDLWSPYASIKTEQELELSKLLPYPSGEKLINSSKLVDIKEDYLDLVKTQFTKYLNLFNFYKGKIRLKAKQHRTIKFMLLIKDLLNEDLIYDLNSLTPTILESLSKIVLDKFKLKDPVTSELILDIFNQLVKVIDKHNLYLTDNSKMTPLKLRRIINNSNLNAIYNIITDAVNLLQSMTSVDGVTEPVKLRSYLSRKASADMFLGAGNIYSLGRLINTNYSGKDCIAKSASSMKAFFKLTLYYNTVLNYGSELDLYMLLANKGFQNIPKILANVRSLDPNSVVYEDLEQYLLTANTIEDAANGLSALLGLSADNAKELVLDKINAGIDMIGLYLYGISVGMNIPTISLTLMSRSSDILLEVMSGDFMNEDLSMSIDRAFTYFDNGPDLSKFNRGFKKSDITSPDSRSVYSPAFNVVWSILELTGLLKSYDKRRGLKDNPLYRVDKLIKLIKLKNSYISDDLVSKALGNLTTYLHSKGLLNNINLNNILTLLYGLYRNKVADDKIIEVVDFIKKYIRLKSELYSKPLEYRTLKELSIGSRSMLMIGSIAGLNLGIPTDLNSFINKIKVIEDYIVELYKLKLLLLEKPIENKMLNNSINLWHFITDPYYMDEKIEVASNFLVNFNLLHVIKTLPDIREYVTGLAIIDKFLKDNSGRYRYIREVFNPILKTYGLRKKNVVDKISRYVLSAYILKFLDSESQGIRYTKSGEKYHVKPFRFPISGVSFSGGVLTKTNDLTVTEVDLSTQDGIAYFKYWMESKVIPSLKDKYKDIKFILDLLGSSRRNTISGNEMVAYTLPVNMMSKEGSNDDILFKKYLDSFNNMDAIYEEEGNTYNVKDLLFYYALTAFEWRPGQNSLYLIFKEDILRPNSRLKDYYYFLSVIDKLEIPLDLYPSLQNACFAAKSPFTDPGAEFVWYLDDATGKKVLYKKDSNKLGYDLLIGDLEDEWIDLLDIEDFDNPEDDLTTYTLKGYTPLETYDYNYYPFGRPFAYRHVEEEEEEDDPNIPNFTMTDSNGEVLFEIFDNMTKNARVKFKNEEIEKKYGEAIIVKIMENGSKNIMPDPNLLDILKNEKPDNCAL